MPGDIKVTDAGGEEPLFFYAPLTAAVILDGIPGAVALQTSDRTRLVANNEVLAGDYQVVMRQAAGVRAEGEGDFAAQVLVKLESLQTGIGLMGTAVKALIASKLRWTSSNASGGTSRPPNAKFRKNVTRAYGTATPEAAAEGVARCMVTGVLTQCVAGHIVGHNQIDFRAMYSLLDLDDAKNGVMWAGIYEEAYDDSRVGVEADSSRECFTTHVLDKRLLHLTLADPLPPAAAGDKKRRPVACTPELKTIKWRDLDGQKWEYEFKHGAPRPHSRGFNVQLMSAIALATDRGHLNETLGVAKAVRDMQWSDDGAKVQMTDIFGTCKALSQGRSEAMPSDSGHSEAVTSEAACSDVEASAAGCSEAVPSETGRTKA